MSDQELQPSLENGRDLAVAEEILCALQEVRRLVVDHGVQADSLRTERLEFGGSDRNWPRGQSQ